MKNGVSYWGMKAMTTFSHCWKKEVFSTPCSRMNCYNSLTASTLFPKVHPISEDLEQEGLYMRLVTKKDKSYYVYGIKDSGFYLKDVSLPQKYRFGNIRFDGRGMSADEQKHYLYDHVFKALNASLGYEDFKKRLAEESIRVTEHVNSKGAYGISFYMENVENAHVFKGADLSRKLTYQNIQKHFDGVAVGLSPHIDRVGEFRERVDREAFYMQGGGVMAIPELDITGSGKKSQEDDLIPSKKKRKRKSGPDFSL